MLMFSQSSNGYYLAVFWFLLLIVKKSQPFPIYYPARQCTGRLKQSALYSANKIITIPMDDGSDEDDESDDDDDLTDPYEEFASSEFGDLGDSTSERKSIASPSGKLATTLDWGGALGKLRQRVEDMEQGKSGDPSQALFRLMSAQSPNQLIEKFVTSTNPQVVQAMSGAVGSLLGGLSSPTSGVETIVKATGDKLGSLCFQLMMTGYMFRNVEYVIALKSLMKLRGSSTLEDYRDAFDRLDKDNSGFIEASEVADLLSDGYDGETPAFEIEAFMRFFDQNNDGKVSWAEFERGLGAAIAAQQVPNDSKFRMKSQESDDDDDAIPDMEEPAVSGTISVELEGGKTVEVDAKEYIQSLKDEAKALKDAIAKEKGGDISASYPAGPNMPTDEFEGISSYIASMQGDVKALTQGISPEIVETMKMLIDFVLEGGDSAKGKNIPKEEMEMEIPGAALQQLALWQLVLGYRLREAEAKGDYLKLLD